MKNIHNRSVKLESFTEESDDDMTICRCEEVSKGEIRRAIHDGMFTMTEIKRFIRPGMGPCQGQRCGPLVQRILARELQVSPDMLEPPTSRPPVRPIKMQVLADEIKTPEDTHE